jgi:putative transposase
MSEGSTAAVDTAAMAKNGSGRPADDVESDLVAQLVGQARAACVQLTGDGGLLQQLTKRSRNPPWRGDHRPPGL